MHLFKSKEVETLKDQLEASRSQSDTLASRNEQLMTEVSELKEFKLKYKIAKMYIDDDEALDELLTAHKAKESASNAGLQQEYIHIQQAGMGQAASAFGGGGLYSGQQMAGLSGLAGLGAFAR